MAGVADATFDVEAEISDFVTDPTRASLELPHMTTGQRKHAKKVADVYPQITCESFGFGQERQLHLFKKDLCAESGPTAVQRTGGDQPVSVKNTFIDDFIDGEKEDSVMFRSMPPQLTKKDMQGSIMQSPTKLIRRPAAIGTDCSTNGSAVSSSPSVSMGSPASSTRECVPVSPPPGFEGLRDLHRFAPPPGLEVRNTFIHYSDASRDERAVQSMPHGMFGKCLLEEYNAVSALGPPPTVAEPTDVPLSAASRTATKDRLGASAGPIMPSVLAEGAEVMIQGLLKCPAFNGQLGVVQSFDGETGRYTILLNTPAGDAQQHKTAKVKGDNLRVITAPPPSHPPSLSMDDCYFQGAGFPSFPPTPMCGDYAHPAHTLRLTALV